MAFQISWKEARRLYRSERLAPDSWRARLIGHSEQKKQFGYLAFCDRALRDEPAYRHPAEGGSAAFRAQAPRQVRESVQSFLLPSASADASGPTYKIMAGFALLAESVICVASLWNWQKIIADPFIRPVLGAPIALIGLLAALPCAWLRAARREQFRALAGQITEKLNLQIAASLSHSNGRAGATPAADFASADQRAR